MSEMGIREYARHRKVSHVAVIKAVHDGRISKLANGKIDSVAADRDWLANTDVSRASVGDAPAAAGDLFAADDGDGVIGDGDVGAAVGGSAATVDHQVSEPASDVGGKGGEAESNESTQRSRTDDEAVALEYRKQRADRERLTALKAQAEYDQMMGRLIDKDWAIECAATVFRSLRDSLENLPARMCHQLAVDVEPESVERALESEIRACLAAVNVKALFIEEDDG